MASTIPEAGAPRHADPRPRPAAPPDARPGHAVIEDLTPLIDGGRYRAKRCVGDAARGRDDLPRRPRQPAGARALPRAGGCAIGARPRSYASTRAVGGDRWSGALTVDAVGRWRWQVAAFTDRFATWREELERKLAAGQSELSSELAEGAALLAELRDRAEEPERTRFAGAARAASATSGPIPARAPPRRSTRRCSRRRGRYPDRGEETRSAVVELDVERERARFGSWYELFPRSWGGFAGVRAAAAAVRGARLRRPLPAADPPDRRDAPQGPQRRSRGRPGRPRQPVGDRRRPRADTPRCTPSSARSRTSTAWSRRGAAHGIEIALDFAAAVLGRPSVAARAPGVVPPPPRRDAQVRREPAQALLRHLQRRLRLRGLARAVGGAARRGAVLGRARRPHLPRRQPAHQAARLLGVADRVGPRRRPRDGLPVARRSRARR